MLPDVLTLREAASLLRLSPRTLYDLARSRRVPAAQAGGKWLFPRAQLQAWLADAARPEGGRAPPPPIIAGSSDPLLEWAVRQAAPGLAIAGGGSLAGLDSLAAGTAVAASVHVVDPDSRTFNEAAARAALGADAVGLVWGWRIQGLIVPRGNPAGIVGIADLARPGLVVAGRQPRAGSHLLMVHLLSEAGIRLDALTLMQPPALAEDEVAAAVAEGRAAVGFGIAPEAALRGLDFVPLTRERFDLVLRPADAFRAPLLPLLDFVRTEPFRTRATRLGGYDVSAAGRPAFVL